MWSRGGVGWAGLGWALTDSPFSVEQLRTLKPISGGYMYNIYITEWDYSKSTASGAKNSKSQNTTANVTYC